MEVHDVINTLFRKFIRVKIRSVENNRVCALISDSLCDFYVQGNNTVVARRWSEDVRPHCWQRDSRLEGMLLGKVRSEERA